MIGLSTDLGPDPVVKVHTTNGRGFTVEEIADRFIDQMLHVADTAHPEVRAQAIEFKDRIRALAVIHLANAIRGDRTTLYNRLKKAGHDEMAEILRVL
jgi:hypothetical protein